MTIVILSVLALATLSYGIFTLLISIGLLRKQNGSVSEDTPDVAVIIAARNEEQNLPGLLSDLANQNYKGKLDIYIADDRSTDATWSILDAFAKKHPGFHPIRVTRSSVNMTPKKNALTLCLKLFVTLRRFVVKTQPFQYFLHRNKATENVVFCYAKQEGFAAVQIF